VFYSLKDSNGQPGGVDTLIGQSTPHIYEAGNTELNSGSKPSWFADASDIGNASAPSPFANLSGYDFHLASDLNNWYALGAPYNVDIDGVTRTSSRGAYQYTNNAAPTPPAGLTAVVQ